MHLVESFHLPVREVCSVHKSKLDGKPFQIKEIRNSYTLPFLGYSRILLHLLCAWGYMKNAVLAIVASVFLFPADGFGIEYRRQAQDVRSLGMGNTGIASAHTSSAIFYNPAVLANITEGWIDLPAVQAIYSDGAKSLYKDIQGSGFLETKKEQQDFMDKYIGEEVYIQADVGASFFFNVDPKGFTVGGNWLYERIYDYEVSNPPTPQIEAFERYDRIKQIGFSYPIGLGQIVLGVAGKVVRRSEKSFVFTTSQMLAEEKFPSPGFPDVNDGETADGHGWDIGFLWRIPTRYKWAVGGVWRKEVDLDEKVANVPEESAIGATMAHTFGVFRWTFALDLRDISFKQGSDGDRSKNRRVHTGMELSIFPTSDLNYLLSLRAGYNQGYPTTGAELRLGNLLVLGYARYTEETGEYGGEKGSKRTAWFVSFGF